MGCAGSEEVITLCMNLVNKPCDCTQFAECGIKEGSIGTENHG